MAAARRKGKWVGGTPVLGYDVAATGRKLVVNSEEARRVQAIFDLYLQHRSVASVLAEVQTRNWTTNRWLTRDGKDSGGTPFGKPTLERLLKNVLYVGKVSHQNTVYAGEQAPIVEEGIWKLVNESLAQERTRASVAAAASATARRRAAAGRAGVERSEPVPRVARLLALALKFEKLIELGVVSNYSAVAQVSRVSRSRVTQMTSLLNLSPDIQEEILFLPAAEARKFRVSEPSLRKLTATLLWNQQREQWRTLRSLGARKALAEQAIREKKSHIGYLEALLLAEIEERERNTIERRIKEAHLPRVKTLEEFDYTQSPHVTAAKMRDLAEGGYVERAEPVLFIGECDPATFCTSLLRY